VDFFEPPPAPQPKEEPFEQKPWFGSPRNELGVSTGLRLVLARTDDVALAVIDVVAFTTGVSLNLVALRRTPGDPGTFDHPFGHFWLPTHKGGELPPGRLESYHKLQDEQAHHARQIDQRLQLEQKRLWKNLTKAGNKRIREKYEG